MAWYRIQAEIPQISKNNPSILCFGQKIKKQVNEKQVVFWSEKYAKRAKAEREAALTKARDLAKNPGNYTRATSYGAAKYVKK